MAGKSTPRVETPKISFEEHVKGNQVHPGLIASFSYEASKDGLDLATEKRTSEAWKKALSAQSERPYQ